MTPAPRTSRPVTVAMAAMEMTPLVKVGGLADMVGALARILAARGHDVTVVLPAYPFLLDRPDLEPLPRARFTVPYAGSRRRVRFHRPGPGFPRVFLIEDPVVSGREGIYVDPATREEYPDSDDRFAIFPRAFLELLRHVDLAPDVVHLHDYQTALAASYLKRSPGDDGFFARTASVLTLHNVGHQGIYDPAVLGRAGLDPAGFRPGGPLEFWGKVNYLKAGVVDADRVTTVSPRYAEEIRSDHVFGRGLEGVLAAKGDRLSGILNGIDTVEWDPARDPHLAAPFGPADLAGKAEDKRALLRRTGLPETPERPVVGMVTRLVDQKGIDLVRAAAGRMLELDLLLVVLGSGQPGHEAFFRALAGDHPDRVFYSADFDDPLAHAIEAGADIFLMPSRYEPCGLNQMMSLRYGTVPVVHRTGGLADTVRAVGAEAGSGTGFVFEPYTAEAMMDALERALEMRRDPESWSAIQRRGMSEDFSWERSADSYLDVYREAVQDGGTR